MERVRWEEPHRMPEAPFLPFRLNLHCLWLQVEQGLGEELQIVPQQGQALPARARVGRQMDQQQRLPEHARARVSSYDALGSFVLTPLGAAVAGPIAAVVGVTATLIGTFAIEVACLAVIIAQPSVWAIGREPARVPVPA